MAKISVSLNDGLLAWVDKCADASYCSRSGFICRAIYNHLLTFDCFLKRNPKDEFPPKYFIGE